MCQPSGVSLIEIAGVSRAPTDQFALATLSVDTNGVWQLVERKGKAITKQSSGCLSRADLAEVRRSLRRATWKFTRAQITCKAYAFTGTQYRIDGRPVMTRYLCDGIQPDRSTANAIRVLDRVLGPLRR